MRQTTGPKRRAQNVTMLAATLACYLTGVACVLGLAYSVAALAAPGLKRQAAAVNLYYGL